MKFLVLFISFIICIVYSQPAQAVNVDDNMSLLNTIQNNGLSANNTVDDLITKLVKNVRNRLAECTKVVNYAQYVIKSLKPLLTEFVSVVYTIGNGVFKNCLSLDIFNCFEREAQKYVDASLLNTYFAAFNVNINDAMNQIKRCGNNMFL